MKLGLWLILVGLAHTTHVQAAATPSSRQILNAAVLDHRKHRSLPFNLMTGSSSCSKVSLVEALDGPSSDDKEEEETQLILRGGAASSESSSVGSLVERLKIGFYFALWYALNIVYNSK